MSSPKIPLNASPEVQECFRLIWVELERLNGKNNVDFHGKRIINAGDSVDLGDYVTRRELTAEATTPLSGALDSIAAQIVELTILVTA